MKNAIAKLVPRFNTSRMVRQYTTRFYVPAIKLTRQLTDDNLAGAHRLTAWKDRVRAAWPDVAVKAVHLESPDEVAVGDPVRVSADVVLGSLSPDDVAVEVYHGPTGGGQSIDRGRTVRMQVGERGADGVWRYTGEIATGQSGAHAFSVRIVPYSATMSHPYETSLIRWG
jgi:starch phosphorylase